MSFDPINFTKENIGPSRDQTAEMQNKMMEMQKKLASLEVEGSAGLDSYLVKVCLNGRYEAVRVTVDPLLLSQTVEVLNGLLAAAITDAAHRTEAAIQREFMNAMQGFKLPG